MTRARIDGWSENCQPYCSSDFVQSEILNRQPSKNPYRIPSAPLVLAPKETERMIQHLRRFLPKGLAGIMTACCLVVAGCTTTAVNHSPAGGQNSSPTIFFRQASCYCGGYLGTYQYNGHTHYERFDSTTDNSYWEDGFINAQGYSHDVLASIGAKAHLIRLNLYKNAIFVSDRQTGTGSNVYVPTGIAWAEANPNHMDWFLTSDSPQGCVSTCTPLAPDESNAIRSSSYSPYMLMDPGNVVYQNLWAGNVIAQLQRDGWDGVFVDDIFGDPGVHNLNPPKYNTRALWQAAVRSFLQNVASQIRAAGFIVIANMNNNDGWEDWNTLVDGSMQEGWMRPTVSVAQAPITGANWMIQLNLAASNENAGKYYQAMIPADADQNDDQLVDSDQQAILYGLTSAMLVNNGHVSVGISGYTSNNNAKYYEAIWGQEFDLARQLGAPLGSYTTLGTYLYQRNFQNGSVFVNADVVSHNIDVNGASQALAAASGVIVASPSP